MRADLRIKLGHRPGRCVPAPWHALALRQQQRYLRRCARLPGHQRDIPGITGGRQPAPKRIDIAQRRRKPGTAHIGRQTPQPRQTQRQQIAPLGRRQRVQLVNHHPPQRGKQLRALGIRQQQRQRFRRRQQHMRRPRPLAGLVLRWRVGAAGFHTQIQANFIDRRHQVAPHILCQRLQRRDIKRVQSLGRRLAAKRGGRKGGKRRQEAREGFASAGIRHQQGITPFPCRRQHFSLVSPQRPAPAGKPFGDFRRQWAGSGTRHPAQFRLNRAEGNPATTAKPPPSAHQSAPARPLPPHTIHQTTRPNRCDRS